MIGISLKTWSLAMTALAACLPRTAGVTLDPVGNDPQWPGSFPNDPLALAINVQYDDFPEETQWTFEKKAGDGEDAWEEQDSSQRHVLLGGVNTENSTDLLSAKSGEVAVFLQSGLTTETFYRISLLDSGGNGLCCRGENADLNGWVTVTVSNTDESTTNETYFLSDFHEEELEESSEFGVDGTVLISMSHFQYNAEMELYVDSEGHVTLTGLKGAEFSFNKFLMSHGPIPTEIGILSDLQWLDLSMRNLKGSIPSEITLLSHLERLDLSGNMLEGSIPCFLGGEKMTYLDLSENKLDGQICTHIGSKMPNLVHLDLHFNDLTGTLPTEIGLLTSLTHFQANDNMLSGALPPHLGFLTGLEFLRLNFNSFTELPDSMGLMTRLETLHVSENDLVGTIPTSLGWMTSLKALQLALNRLTGSIPSELGQLWQLVSLDLSHVTLTGAVPSELGNLSKLTDLQLRWNNDGLTGEVPDGVCDAPYVSFDCNANLCGCPARPYNPCPCHGKRRVQESLPKSNFRG